MTAERYLFAGLLVWLVLRSCAAHAQSDDALVRDVVRLAFHESTDPLADAPGIHAVLVNGARARGTSTRAFARSYAPRFFRGVSRRPWWLALELSCDRPAGFAGNWTRDRGVQPSLRATCLATVALVRSLETPVCDATLWGSAADFRSGRFATAHRHVVFVSCGDGARNLFAHPPRAE